jgi:hypothetical protein
MMTLEHGSAPCDGKGGREEKDEEGAPRASMPCSACWGGLLDCSAGLALERGACLCLSVSVWSGPRKWGGARSAVGQRWMWMEMEMGDGMPEIREDGPRVGSGRWGLASVWCQGYFSCLSSFLLSRSRRCSSQLVFPLVVSCPLSVTGPDRSNGDADLDPGEPTMRRTATESNEWARLTD